MIKKIINDVEGDYFVAGHYDEDGWSWYFEKHNSKLSRMISQVQEKEGKGTSPLTILKYFKEKGVELSLEVELLLAKGSNGTYG